MEMSEIRSALPNCPNCGRHCPIDALNCARGRELVSRLISGQLSLEEACGGSASSERKGDGAGRHHHGTGEHHHHHRDASDYPRDKHAR